MVRRIPKQVRQPQVLDVHMSFRLVGRMRMSKVLPHESLAHLRLKQGLLLNVQSYSSAAFIAEVSAWNELISAFCAKVAV